MYGQTSEDSAYSTCAQCDSLYERISSDTHIVFEDNEHIAEFSGGAKELLNFLRDNIEYPLECKEKAIEGTVVIQFIIDESGKIICPRFRTTIHPELDKEALRVVKLMPDWSPASNDGVPCKTCFWLPILFKL